MTLEKMNKMNDVMITVLKLVYINILWVAFSALGLVIFSVGPATYAMMKYYDRWLRCQESLPVARTMWGFFKERFVQSMIVSWIYIAVAAIFITNIFLQKIWYFQWANIFMLVMLLFSFTHVYTVMAATTYQKLIEIFRGAFLLGFGYLHYTIIAWTIIGLAYFLAARFAPALVFVFGMAFVGFIFGQTGKIIFRDIKPV